MYFMASKLTNSLFSYTSNLYLTISQLKGLYEYYYVSYPLTRRNYLQERMCVIVYKTTNISFFIVQKLSNIYYDQSIM